MPERSPDKWEVWSNHVLAELERLNKEITEIKKETNDYRIIAEGRYQSLNVKSGLFGILGGAVIVLIPILMKLSGLM